MLFVDNIKKYLAEKKINKVLASQDREIYFPDFKELKTILILFKCEENEQSPFIRKLVDELTEKKKKVTVWGYVDKKELESPILPQFRLFCNADTNSYDIPKPSLVNEFKSQSYDMVIQITSRDLIQLDYLLAVSNSLFRVSRVKTYQGIADFMINVSETDDDLFYYDQIMHYLKSIQAKRK